MSVTGPKLQPTLFELSGPGRAAGRRIPAPPADALDRLPSDSRRAVPAALPEVDEQSLVRHYVNLSQLNWGVDTGFYPLGSCTMKYNPKVNEWAARLPGFAGLHPLAPDETAQGTLELLWELEPGDASLAEGLLVCATESTTAEEIELFAWALRDELGSRPGVPAGSIGEGSR